MFVISSHIRCMACLLALGVAAQAGAADPPQTTTLFDGTSLDGWEGNQQVWRVEDGAITGEIAAGQSLPRNEFIFWKDDVHDFELTLQYRIEGHKSANSGIQFRSQRLEDGGAAGYQADLDLGATWLGRIYDEHARALLVERGQRVSIAPDGRRWEDPFADAESFRDLPTIDGWNTYRIKAVGPHIEVWINGRLCSVLDDHQQGEADHSGALGLQLHSGPGPVKIQFRDIRLTHLGQTAVPPAETASLAVEEDRQSQSPVLWHLRPNPAEASAVENVEAQKVVADMWLVDGFEAELVAAEPEIHQPIAFAIDERGRLWIAEAFSYPNKQPEGEGKDRIRILEDSDGDGVFETKKTFVEGLNLVSGIEVGFGGVWIGAAPELLFIPDRDGDDRADGPPEVLLDGFGFQDTHETLNSFIWGPDGWLYGNQGVFNSARIGKPGAPDSERVALRAGVWRYHPVRHEFEVFAHGGSNQWGLDFNEAGHLFMTHCRSYWGGGGTTHVIRNGHFWNQTNSEYAPFVSNSAPQGIPHLQNFLPASARYDSGEGGAGKPGTRAVYGGHSHVGTMIYLGDNWPAIYRDHLFTHNLHGHQMNHQVNVRQGSAYETLHAGADLMYAPDAAYIPVDLKVGPDGAVYIIDWVDRQHCHNPRAEQWDRSNGRIYRVAWAESYRPVSVDLGAKSDLELLELQGHPNRWFGRTARRLLQQRAAGGELDDQAVAAAVARVDQAGDEAEVLAALWTLHVTDHLGAAQVQTALEHRSDIVRAWAVALATDGASAPTVATEAFERVARKDPSPTVRLALASAMPQLATEARWRVGEALAAHGEDAADRFLPKMIWYGLAPLVAEDVSRGMQLAASTPLLSLRDSIYWYAARQPAGRDALSERIAGAADDAQAARLVRLMQFSLQYEARLPEPQGWSKVRERIVAHGDGGTRAAADELSAIFGNPEVLASLRTVLADAAAPVDQRRRALTLLRRVGDDGSAAIYLALLDEPQLRAEVIPMLARFDEPAAAEQLIARFDSFSDTEQGAALGVLTARPSFAVELLRAVEEGAFAKEHLTALQIRQMSNLGSAEVDRRLEQQWGKVGGSSADAEKAIARLRHNYTTAPLWAYDAGRGRQIYQKSCAACHPLDDRSQALGPDLSASWRNGLDYFLENILDPNAVVGETFRTTVILTSSGNVVSGLLESETDTAIVLRTAEETVTVPKEEVEERRLVSQSIMPTGLLDDLSETETIELLKFLTSQR